MHLNQQTNISSPFISVYDNLAHAEAVAKHFGERYGEDTWVVTVDPAHFARGPVFRAMDILKDSAGGKDANAEWLHYGEYLVMYRIRPDGWSVLQLLTRFGYVCTRCRVYFPLYLRWSLMILLEFFCSIVHLLILALTLAKARYSF